MKTSPALTPAEKSAYERLAFLARNGSILPDERDYFRALHRKLIASEVL